MRACRGELPPDAAAPARLYDWRYHGRFVRSARRGRRAPAPAPAVPVPNPTGKYMCGLQGHRRGTHRYCRSDDRSVNDAAPGKSACSSDRNAGTRNPAAVVAKQRGRESPAVKK